MRNEDPFWYTTKAGKLGGDAAYKKYGVVGGDQEFRKKKWLEWWEEMGKLDSTFPLHPLPFRKPEKSVELAEFIGTMMVE